MMLSRRQHGCVRGLEQRQLGSSSPAHWLPMTNMWLPKLVWSAGLGVHGSCASTLPLWRQKRPRQLYRFEVVPLAESCLMCCNFNNVTEYVVVSATTGLAFAGAPTRVCVYRALSVGDRFVNCPSTASLDALRLTADDGLGVVTADCRWVLRPSRIRTESTSNATCRDVSFTANATTIQGGASIGSSEDTAIAVASLAPSLFLYAWTDVSRLMQASQQEITSMVDELNWEHPSASYSIIVGQRSSDGGASQVTRFQYASECFAACVRRPAAIQQYHRWADNQGFRFRYDA